MGRPFYTQYGFIQVGKQQHATTGVWADVCLEALLVAAAVCHNAGGWETAVPHPPSGAVTLSTK
ncbi:MAG: hypothetical protein R3D55_06735 [Chloroflexota bacterium]